MSERLRFRALPGLRKATLTLRRTTRQRVNETTSGASLCFADYKTTSQRDNEWGFAALRRIYGVTDLRNYGELRFGFAGASPDYETTSNRFAKATLSFADNETTSQQDNEWGFAALRQTTRQQDNEWGGSRN